jgi:hypothetical protein
VPSVSQAPAARLELALLDPRETSGAREHRCGLRLQDVRFTQGRGRRSFLRYRRFNCLHVSQPSSAYRHFGANTDRHLISNYGPSGRFRPPRILARLFDPQFLCELRLAPRTSSMKRSASSRRPHSSSRFLTGGPLQSPCACTSFVREPKRFAAELRLDSKTCVHSDMSRRSRTTTLKIRHTSR